VSLMVHRKCWKERPVYASVWEKKQCCVTCGVINFFIRRVCEAGRVRG
jgi:hypothetical protein